MTKLSNEEKKARASAYAREWRKKNPEKQSLIKKREWAKNKEARSAKHKEWYAANREKVLHGLREKRRANHEAAITKQRARRAANPEKFRGYQRAHKSANPHLWHLYSVRKSAKAKGLQFDLDAEWFKSRLDAGVCEMSGLPFKPGTSGPGSRNPDAPSVDRKDPAGPYTKENCRMVLWWLNRALSNLGEEYSIAVFRAVFIKRGEIQGYEDRIAA